MNLRLKILKVGERYKNHGKLTNAGVVLIP